MIEELRLALPGIPSTPSAACSPSEARVEVAGLVETYAGTLFRVARSVTGSAAEAEDVVQDTFVRVMEHRRDLPNVRDMRVWLVRIAWNLALDRRRRKRGEPLDDLLLAKLCARGVHADTQASERQRLTLAWNAIERLPVAERQALLLTALDELSAAEVAAVLGKSDSAVRALIFRARQRLRERLGKDFAKGGLS